MNNFLFNSQSKENVISPAKVTNASRSYFDTISTRLDSWQASQLAIRERCTQLIKSMLIKDTDTITGISKTFRVSVELIATEQANTLELPEMEGSSYVS
jgi:hypothetical protein